MKKLVFPALVVTFAAGAAIAQDDPVEARMELMKMIGGATKTLGDMVKGETAFDAEEANTALQVIASNAGLAPSAFETEATNDESEALPAIWSNWEDFVSKAQALEIAADGLEITDEASVQTALGVLGQACKACHSEYRE